MGATWAAIVAGTVVTAVAAAAARGAFVASRRLGDATGALIDATNELADAGLAVRTVRRILGVVADGARARTARVTT